MSLRSAVVVTVLMLAAPVAAGLANQQASPVTMTIRTPDPEQFELMLNEVELRWRETATKAGVGAAPRSVPQAALKSTVPGRAIYDVAGAFTADQLRPVIRDLEAANPDGTAHLVLYEAGRRHTTATRRLLGREVAAIVGPGMDGMLVLSGGGARNIRPLPAVPGGFVVLAADPFEAIELSATLAGLPGVQTAYPLLLRQQSTR